MIPVFLAQLTKECRNPLLLIIFIAASIGATIIFTDGTQSPTTVSIFSEEENARSIEEKWEPLLNEDSDMRFVITDSEEAREDVQQGRADLAIKLLEDDYRLVTTSNLPTVAYVDQHVRKVFEKEATIQSAIEQSEDAEGLRADIETRLEAPPMEMEVDSITGDELPNYDMGTQLMFAFTLLVAMFIIGFRINNILKDKVYGLWDRMILSPVSKTGMYTAYIAYAFFIGVVQTLSVILTFKYVLNYDIGDRLDLLIIIIAFFTFSMVSVATLLTGLVKKPEQFYAIYPSVIPIIPLISGAYMMPGTISNPVLTFIADLFPVSHAMDAILNVVMYDGTLHDITHSLLFMTLIGVVAMGIGVNLVERRKN
ncbi:ABC transporter permease [Halobacillus karajensis]|uniref:ABC-2 type transporter, NodJ family n=1 Tax=Halobacillus karajensis TaxID=195088 RepID=A0A024P4X0_9BACI|nr:ABC transporter permease [Halobacillus karajensis]CDQ20707.1 ABC-2 type transporter, NodJ family [Halobacillus karajensis]CDQ23823.1 ABC-2 type transporter, NodJ family [Halobacillus karajensis]CDQ27301.1 ABC-2 type transporter, NodJ family [Halobacillus karajensis]